MKRKKTKQKNQPQMSAVVQYMMRMASNMSVIFLALCAIGLYLGPDEVERGIYIFVIVLNLIIFIGTNVMQRFMAKSDDAYNKAMDKKYKRENKPTISDWLDKQSQK